jgi:hypothetical protein
MTLTAVNGGEDETMARCEARDSNGVRCERERDHDGGHACPEALARFLADPRGIRA